MRDYRKKLYYFCWAIALIVAIILFKNFRLTSNCIGIVEKKSHTLSTQEPGIINNILVRIGDKVNQGQLIATLHMTDLENTLNQLTIELNTTNNLRSAQKNLFNLEFQQMGLSLQNEASDLSERLSLIESKMTEVNALNIEIERLEQAEKAGLGYSRDLAALILRRDALNSYLKEQSKELQYQNQKLIKARSSLHDLKNVNSDTIVNAMLLESMQRTEDIKREINIIKYRITSRTITAPCEGYITDILAYPGDVVNAFIPIMTVEETKPQYATLYLSERSDFQAKIGMQTKINSKRLKRYTTSGIVEFIHPGFAQSNERLSFQGQPFWGRMIRVKLQDNHQFLPGEFVYARINKEKIQKKLIVKTSGDSKKSVVVTEAENRLLDMEVPDPIRKNHRFEPSGLAWLPEKEKYIVISDDTGLKDKKNEHIPLLFLMDDQGRVDRAGIKINGTSKINDLEAITSIGDNRYLLVSSQSINKNGKRPISREKIYEVTYENHQFYVTNQIALLSLIRKSYSLTQLQSLGLTAMNETNQIILNIEGAAYHDNNLYLGLKEPVHDRGAILWILKNPHEIFQKNKLGENQLSLYGYVNLGEHQGRKAGFSDLFIDAHSVMWATSTIPNVDDSDQTGGFHRIIGLDDGHLQSIHYFSFKQNKPEGICIKEMGDMMILFDRNQQIPKFFPLSVEEL